MRVKFYILNHQQQLYQCFILGRESDEKCIIGATSTKPEVRETLKKFLLNSYGLLMFLNELNHCETYRYWVARNIKSSSDPFLIQLTPNKTEYIDRVWGELIRQLVWEQLEAEHMMSWLSTLGGAFSALGDYFEDRADIAGKISIHQIKLSLRIGDPNLIARCRLYFSISLIQQKKFKLAQHIIRQQHQYALAIDDIRLRKMCLGIWSKLQYSYKTYRLKTCDTKRI